MALQDIINTILKEAKTEASKIKDQGDKKIVEINDEGEKKLVKEKAEFDDQATQAAQKEVDKAKFEANIEERNKVVSTKQKVVDKVFESALERLKGLEDDQYVSFLQSLMTNLPDVDEGFIIPVQGREDVTKRALEGSGKSYTMTDDAMESAGGFVFKSKDIEVNNTFEELLVGVREDIEIEVSKKLFS